MRCCLPIPISCILYAAAVALARVQAFYPNSSDPPFSLSAYQRARAQETSAQLDASRFHFQILFLDKDNFHGRIAQGILARIAEYNDALFTLLPYSATIERSRKAPVDSAAPEGALAVCKSLGLCPTTCSEHGTSFNLSDLDQYDLIVALDDEIQSLVLRSLPSGSEDYKKCRTLSEFASIDFCGVQNKNDITDQSIQDMVEPAMWERIQAYYELVKADSIGDSSIFTTSNPTDIYNTRMILSENGAAIPNLWPLTEAAMVVACAGITRFCLDTMDVQFDAAFSNLLNVHFYQPEHLNISVEQADDQLRLGSLSVTGYFSLKERHPRISKHFEELRAKFS